MTYVYWFLVAGLVFNYIVNLNRHRAQSKTIRILRAELDGLRTILDDTFKEYTALKAKIVEKAATSPKVREADPKRYNGAQLRVMNDRLNAQMTEELQERPNSEILKEQAHG